MRKFIAHIFSLKLYGAQLLEPSAALWIVFVRILIVAMALTEAISWGYAGKFLMPGTFGSWVASLFVGTIIFVFVCAMDASFMTLDRSGKMTPKALTNFGSTGNVAPPGSEVTFGDRLKSVLSGGVIKMVGGSAARLLLLSSSLYITAPFIALIVFEKDIDAQITSNFSRKVELKSKELKQQINVERKERSERTTFLASQEAELRETLKNRENEMNEEMRNPETRGYGPIAKQFESQIRVTRTQLQKKQDELAEYRKGSFPTPSETELIEFTTRVSARNYEVLSSRWGINVDPNSFVVRNAIIKEEIEPTPEYRKAETAIQAFLGFIFIGLLTLKIYEPHAVKIYFNAALQSDWARYQAKMFDDYLLFEERSVAKPCGMTTFRFEVFVVTELPRLLALSEMKRADRRARIDIAEGHRQLAALVAVNDEWFVRRDAQEGKLNSLRAELIGIDSMIKENREQGMDASSRLMELSDQEREIENAICGDVSPAHLKLAMKMQQSVTEKKMAAHKDVAISKKEEEQLESRRRDVVGHLRATEVELNALTLRLTGIERLQTVAQNRVTSEIEKRFQARH